MGNQVFGVAARNAAGKIGIQNGDQWEIGTTYDAPSRWNKRVGELHRALQSELGELSPEDRRRVEADLMMLGLAYIASRT